CFWKTKARRRCLTPSSRVDLTRTLGVLSRPFEEESMELSARNQIAGRITNVRVDGIMAEVSVDIGGGKEIVSTITRSSAQRLDLKAGDQITAIIKASEVLIAK